MKHYEYLCKYDPGTALPAIAFKRCDECEAFLCPSCGYNVQQKSAISGQITYHYCNECYAKLGPEELSYFPPQGEPAGNDPELTEKEAIKDEQNSHTHF